MFEVSTTVTVLFIVGLTLSLIYVLISSNTVLFQRCQRSPGLRIFRLAIMGISLIVLVIMLLVLAASLVGISESCDSSGELNPLVETTMRIANLSICDKQVVYHYLDCRSVDMGCTDPMGVARVLLQDALISMEFFGASATEINATKLALSSVLTFSNCSDTANLYTSLNQEVCSGIYPTAAAVVACLSIVVTMTVLLWAVVTLKLICDEDEFGSESEEMF